MSLPSPHRHIPRKAGSSPRPARSAPTGRRIFFATLGDRLPRADSGLRHSWYREEQIPSCRLVSRSARDLLTSKGNSGLMRVRTTGICLSAGRPEPTPCDQAGAEKSPGPDLARPPDCILAAGQTHKADTSRACIGQQARPAIRGLYSVPKAKPRSTEWGETQRHPPANYHPDSSVISRLHPRVSDAQGFINLTFKGTKIYRPRYPQRLIKSIWHPQKLRNVRIAIRL